MILAAPGEETTELEGPDAGGVMVFKVEVKVFLNSRDVLRAQCITL